VDNWSDKYASAVLTINGIYDFFRRSICGHLSGLALTDCQSKREMTWDFRPSHFFDWPLLLERPTIGNFNDAALYPVNGTASRRHAAGAGI
jgi:hypothetical protein